MKLKYIDALRGVAIMGVLIVHCGMHGSNEHLPSLVQSIILNGAHGVQLFYIASAFTLFLTLSNRQGVESYPWFNFFLRRFFRIAPMYYLGICYYLWQDGFGARYWLGDGAEISLWNVLSNVFFVHGFSPYWINSVVPGGWSIAVEMLFYSLIPLLFGAIKNTHQAFVFCVLALFFRTALQFLFGRFALIEDERLWIDYLYIYFPSQLPVFALGILFYFIVKENYRLTVSPAFILISSFILIAQVCGISLLPNHVLLSVAFVVLAIALSKYEFKLFVNPVLIYIGKVSYSMYLVHFAILYWLTRIDFVDFLSVTGPVGAIANYGIRLSLLTLLTVTVSSVTYNMIELPLQRFGRRLIHYINNRRTFAVGAQNLPGIMGTSPDQVVIPPIIKRDSAGTSMTMSDEK